MLWKAAAIERAIGGIGDVHERIEQRAVEIKQNSGTRHAELVVWGDETETPRGDQAPGAVANVAHARAIPRAPGPMGRG